MTTKVQKWGNSLAVRLSKATAEKIGLKQGSPVSIVSDKNLISIKPIFKKRENLDQMVKRINKKNTHDLVDWGKMVGKEIW